MYDSYTLGLGGSNHDFSAAILNNGRLKIAIEDERISRIKHGNIHWSSKSCQLASEYCLNAIGIDYKDVENIYMSSDLEGGSSFLKDLAFTKIGHHTCHGASSYYNSPFNNSAILVIDGKGGPISDSINGQQSFETLSYGVGKKNKLETLTKLHGMQQIAASTWSYITSNSIGWFYSIITEALGFGENGEGKTMALAAYGVPVFEKELSSFLNINKNLELDFNVYSGIWDFLINTIYKSVNKFKTKADLAASAQKILEDFILAHAQSLQKQTKQKNLSYSGGVALNGVLNQKIKEKSGFSNIFIFPACGDNGLSVGAALYGYYHLEGHKRIPSIAAQNCKIAYLGKDYTDNEIKKSIDSLPVASYKCIDLKSELLERLLQGQVIAIFQGKSEFGPRALGNRSLIALPDKFNVQSKLNRIKNREEFRPFAPIILESEVSKYFDLYAPSPFMLQIASVRKQYRAKIPGACHIDGSARVQTVNQHGPSHIFNLLNYMKQKDIPPIILNTSFNLRGKPIVETPIDALETFIMMDLDALFIGQYVVLKHGNLNLKLKT